MCFRPPTTSKPKKCPQCGMVNPPSAGLCKQCKSDLRKVETDLKKEEKGGE